MFCFITLTQTRIVEYSKDNKAKFFSLSRKYCSRTPMFSAVQIFGVASLIWMGIKVNSSSPLQFDLDTMKFLRVVDSNFLSIQIDSHSLARHWKVVDLRDSKLIMLAKQLAPAYLRVGGTDQDDIYFCARHNSGDVGDNKIGLDPCSLGEGINNQSINQSKIKITEEDITALGNFVHKTGLDLVYGLNVLQRDTQDWDPTNSLALMNYMTRIGLVVKSWELGNEPRRFKKVFNTTVPGDQLGKDFNRLKSLLGLGTNESIVGPDLAHLGSRRSRRYVSQFFKELDPSTLDVFSFHDYYFSGKTATLPDFLDVMYMEKLRKRIGKVSKIVASFRPNLPVWIGETASAYGGGAQNLSDRFVSGFMWLDKLGQSARSGVSVVVRQTLVGNVYGLIDSEGRPTPSYFISYIFKQLVSHVVLAVDNFLVDNKAGEKTGLRFYTHCHKDLKGGIVIFGMNLETNPVKIEVKRGRRPIKMSEYLLTPLNGDLTSRWVVLNGKVLKAGKGVVPKLRPTRKSSSFIVPPNTLGFWVVTNAQVAICV